MTVAIVCAFYFCRNAHRRTITEKVFKHYASVPDSIFIGVGSEGHVSQELLERANPEARYLEFDQDWDYVPPFGHDGLRRKYNYCVEAAREYDPDVVFCLGSDDLVPHAFFTPPTDDALLIGAGQGPDGGAFFFEYQNSNAFWWDGRSPFGDERGSFSGGVLGFSPELLDALDWRPWQFDGDELGIERHVAKTYGPDVLEARYGMPSWHPKCPSVLNSMDLIQRNLTLEDADPEVTRHFLDYWASLGPEGH